MAETSNPPTSEIVWEPKKKKFLEIVCRQCYNAEPPRRWQRAKITKIWDNPFLFRAFELMISTTIAGIFIESNLPLNGNENLALHTGICGPIIPIFALFSSAVMLDGNPKSSIVKHVLLGFSATAYLTTLLVISINWDYFSLNRTKYRYGFVCISALACANLVLLTVDLLTPWIALFCKKVMSCMRKKKKEQKRESEAEPAASPPRTAENA